MLFDFGDKISFQDSFPTLNRFLINIVSLKKMRDNNVFSKKNFAKS